MARKNYKRPFFVLKEAEVPLVSECEVSLVRAFGVETTVPVAFSIEGEEGYTIRVPEYAQVLQFNQIINSIDWTKVEQYLKMGSGLHLSGKRYKEFLRRKAAFLDIPVRAKARRRFQEEWERLYGIQGK